MSSATNTLIQRKTLQACDACRARRGDGRQTEDGVCSNCKRHGQSCNYGTPANALKWGTKAYIEDLQLRIMSVERLIKQYAPDQDLSNLLDDAPSKPDPSPSGSGNLFLPAKFILPGAEHVGTYNFQDTQDVEAFLTTNTAQNGRGEYHGSTSAHPLVEFALEFRDGVKCEPMSLEDRFPNRRQEFWEVQDWMHPRLAPSSRYLEFPPPEVVAFLVDVYFTHSNIYYPVLHPPTFRRLLDEGLHHRDGDFSGILLVVCAIGARFSNHPYLADATAESRNRRIAHWLSQTREVMKKPFTSTATLFEVQYYCLYAICLDGFPGMMKWITLGISVRLVTSVGANHLKTYGDKPTIEGEQWKRVFWVLLNHERLISASLGRPCSIRAEDFDLELPIDCDDEYWPMDDESEGFKQPPGKPSKLTAFILMIKLYHLQADVVRAIYPPNRDPSFRTSEAEKQVFEALDVEMDKWAKSIPEHLKQISFGSSVDSEFVRQSIYLHTQYHKFKMWIRRPYTLPSRRSSPLAPASTAMCTKSATTCFHLLYKLRYQLGADLIHYENPVFVVACTFLINLFSQRPLEDTTQDKELLEMCLEMFEIMERRYHSASASSAIIGGMIREPNFDPLEAHTKRSERDKGWAIDTSKSMQPSTSTNIASSESSNAGATEAEMGLDYFGLDMTFV